jgi:hypothetical protein
LSYNVVRAYKYKTEHISTAYDGIIKLSLALSDSFITHYIKVTPTSVGTVPLPSLNSVVNRLLDRLYWGIPIPQQPITEKHISKDERNQQICLRFASGERLEEIANEYDISLQRVAQLVHRWC